MDSELREIIAGQKNHPCSQCKYRPPGNTTMVCWGNALCRIEIDELITKLQPYIEAEKKKAVDRYAQDHKYPFNPKWQLSAVEFKNGIDEAVKAERKRIIKIIDTQVKKERDGRITVSKLKPVTTNFCELSGWFQSLKDSVR